MLDLCTDIYNHMVVNSLDHTFLALSDPTRRMILDRLRRGAATVNQLAEPFGVSQQAVSKHLAILARADLIEKRKEGRQQFCSLRPASLKAACEWMESYRQFWDDAFERLDVLLMELQQPQPQEKKHVRKRR